MKPLFQLVPDTSPLPGGCWSPFVEDVATQSYSYVLPYGQASSSGWATPSQLDDWFTALHPSSFDNSAASNNNEAWTDASYKGTTLLRKTAWMTMDDACTCDYGYSDTWQPQAKCPPFLTTIRYITQHIRQVTGVSTLNSCNLNYYPQGGGVGFHADDEFLFDSQNRDACIVSLSLCRGNSNDNDSGARKFVVKRQKPGETEDDTQDQYSDTTSQEIVLRHGDIMTMEGMFQKYYFHSVWPGDRQDYVDGKHPYAQGERINLTWRTIVQHLDGSEGCRGKICPLSKSNTAANEKKSK